MLKISGIRLSLSQDNLEALRSKVASILKVPEGAVLDLSLLRKSIDARKKQDVHYVCTALCRLEDEAKALARGGGQVTAYDAAPYQVPPPSKKPEGTPVIVGMGPAGLFCALALSEMGIPSILLDRGRPVERRAEDVSAFWDTGALDPASNVQFGEGGAGTFSDGKLTTGIGGSRSGWVLAQFARSGAPSDILYQQKPHVGTDVLREVVITLRKKLQAAGCTFLYEHHCVDFALKDGALASLTVQTPQGTEIIPAQTAVFALGHSARDTFSLLEKKGATLQQKPFAVGVRAEHDQRAVSLAQYGAAGDRLPPADYKVACHLPGGRSAYSFCVCPGGTVVAAASEQGHLVTNGMSLRARDGGNINGGILVGVDPSDFPGDGPLAGVEFQRRWEQAAFSLGGGGFRAPAQRLEDFLARRPSNGPGTIIPTYRPGVTWTDLRPALPDFVAQALGEAFPLFDQRVAGFAHPDTVLTGIETRSSSPVRIVRDETGQSNLRGLYPCGEGAGYAGGIVSAAVDGIRCAERICGHL